MCGRCGCTESQLIRHVEYEGESYRIIRCLHCGDAKIEPLNPKRRPPTLTLCSNVNLDYGVCRSNHELCSGILRNGKAVRRRELLFMA